MATAKPPPLPKAPLRTGGPPRRWRSALALLLVGLIIALVWFWQPITSYATAGASYGARVACSCRFQGGRSLGDCRKDFLPGMGLVTLSEDAKAKSVTARFPLLSRQTATWREGAGCVLEKWDD